MRFQILRMSNEISFLLNLEVNFYSSTSAQCACEKKMYPGGEFFILLIIFFFSWKKAVSF